MALYRERYTRNFARPDEKPRRGGEPGRGDGERRTNSAPPFRIKLLVVMEEELHELGIAVRPPEVLGRIERAKAFEGSAPVSYVRPDYRSPMPAPADLYLYVGNERRQHGSTGEMTWSAAEIIAEISKTWTLQPGDVVFTGTPAGARPVKRGDLILAGVNGVGSLRVQIH